MRRFICLLLAMAANSAWAFDFDRLQNLAQEDFRLLSEDLGAALSYHPQTPTEPLGVTGFDIGIALTLSKVSNKDQLSRASSESVPSYIPVPTLRANKGLPFGIDVGLMYATIPGSDLSLWGGEARWAFIRGNVAMPAVGIRGTFTRLTGVDELDMRTKGVDISASKGFAFLTPYIGVGRTWITSNPRVGTLAKEDFALTKLFLGAGFKLALLNLNAEVDRTGDSTAYSLKAGIRF